MNVKEKNTVINKINRYDDLLYENGPSTITEYSSEKFDDVHNQLYDSALQKFKTAHPQYDSSYTFVEIKNSEYFKPSSVYVIDQKYPFNKVKESLEKYWDDYKFVNRDDWSYIKIDEDANIQNAKIVNINYVEGIVEMYEKIDDIYFTVPLDRITSNTEVDDDLTLIETFKYELDNNGR